MSEPQPPPLPPPMPPHLPVGGEAGDTPVPLASVAPLSPWAANTPLAYSLPTTSVRPRRPGVVTAIATTSFIVALCGLVGGLGTAAAALVFYAHARQMGTDAQAAMRARAAQPAPVQPVRRMPEVGPEGLQETQRKAVAEALYAIHPLRPPRMAQLDAVLARHGKTLLGADADRWVVSGPAPGEVRRIVLDHGQLFSSGRGNPPEFFRLKSGRLELFDDRAVFYPEDGSPTIRSSLAAPVVRRALTPAEVTAAVENARSLSRDRLNDAQVAALTAALSAENQKLVGPQTEYSGAEPVSVTPAAEGAFSIQFSQGRLDLGRDGRVLATPPAPAPPPAPSTAGLVVVLVASLLGAALAFLLAVAAVQTLRGLPSGRRLHFTWAWLKIPVTAVAAVTLWWMAGTFYEEAAEFQRVFPTVFFSPRQTRWILQPWHPILLALIALIYPVVLLGVLRGNAVREYFHPSE